MLDMAPELVKSLLKQANIEPDDIAVSHFRTGGNNSIFRLVSGGRDFALKKYALDERDRLGAEWCFLSVLHRHFPDAPVPVPFAADPENGLALYSFVAGRKLDRQEINIEYIAQAENFIRLLNTPMMRAGNFKQASEARFSVRGHLDILSKRIERLKNFLDPDLNDFIARLEIIFSDVKNSLQDDGELPETLRCLSPSDFGFHNALADDACRLTFIDFEYAGWDDPAKLSADFFFQPETPVDSRYYKHFLEACLSHVPDADKAAQHERAIRLRPVFGLRWCCIILNPFDPKWVARRHPALSSEALEKLRQDRLQSARKTLRETRGLMSALKGEI